MVYVEWLRVRGALKWMAIVLAAFFVLTGIARIATAGFERDALTRVASMQAERSARVTQSIAPDGAHRIAIDAPKDRTRVVIDDYGWGRKHIVIEDRSSSDHSKDSVVAGSIHVSSRPSGRGSITTIDTNGDVAFADYASVGIIVALIIATVLGAPFARENDGHLEITMTKPVSRIGLGIATMAADATGIVASFVAGIVFALACTLLFEFPHVTFGPEDAVAAILGVVAPLAWYALLNASTAWMKRGHGAILGFAWPIALLVFALSLIQPGGNALLTLVGEIFRAIAVVDPITYIHPTIPVEVGGKATIAASAVKELAALAALALAYGALALVEWRRIEA